MLEVLVVLGVPAVPDLLDGREPQRRGGQQFEDLPAAILGQGRREFRPREDVGDLAEH
jgi:hypothetical protein